MQHDWPLCLPPGQLQHSLNMADQGSDLDLTEDNGGSLVITAAVFLALSWIAVMLRTYTRAVVMKSFQLDDWFMLASQVSRAHGFW